MRVLFLKLAVLLLMCVNSLSALEINRLFLQAQFGLTTVLSPRYMTDYWDNGAGFSGGFGTPISENALFLFNYTHFSFNYSENIIPAEKNAYAHQVLLSYKRFVQANHSRYALFYQVAAGFTLLRSPNIYQEAEEYPGFIEDENFLESAHSDDGPTVSLGLGLSYKLAEKDTRVFLELFSAVSFFYHSRYSILGGRCGILFTI